MTLEAVVFPHDSIPQYTKELYAMAGGPWSCDLEEVEKAMVALEGEVGGGAEQNGVSAWAYSDWVPSCSSAVNTLFGDGAPVATPAAGGSRRKRRRGRGCENRQEAENQRMTHIAVERNRRRQMNEYLAALRSLMPPSYVQRGDQASVIGGAINFVKELEQLLQSLEAQKRLKQLQHQPGSPSSSPPSPFSRFFTFPQYSSSTSPPPPATSSLSPSSNPCAGDRGEGNRGSPADIEVTMVERHANLRVLSRRRPKQLARVVAGLLGLRLAVLHLNATTVEQMVLYSFSLKVEDDCGMSSGEEIAAAVHRMLGEIREEAGF